MGDCMVLSSIHIMLYILYVVHWYVVYWNDLWIWLTFCYFIMNDTIQYSKTSCLNLMLIKAIEYLVDRKKGEPPFSYELLTF